MAPRWSASERGYAPSGSPRAQPSHLRGSASSRPNYLSFAPCGSRGSRRRARVRLPARWIEPPTRGSNAAFLRRPPKAVRVLFAGGRKGASAYGTHVVHAGTEGPRPSQRGDGGRRLLAGGDLPPPGARPARKRARARRLDDAVRPARGVARRAPGMPQRRHCGKRAAPRRSTTRSGSGRLRRATPGSPNAGSRMPGR